MDRWVQALAAGLAIFALNALARRHESWRSTIAWGVVLGGSYGLFWLVLPMIEKAIGHDMLGVVSVATICFAAVYLIREWRRRGSRAR